MQISRKTEIALERAKIRQFERELTHFVRSKFSEEDEFAFEDTLKRVMEQSAHARAYGLDTEQSIAIYVVTAWIMGHSFDSDSPAARQVLASPLSPEEKADWLELWAPAVLERLSHRG